MEEPSTAVIGWVRGAPVGAQDLEDYLCALAPSPAGVRVGLSVAGRPSRRALALRGWGAKALLADRLLAAEGARLGVVVPAPLETWLDRLSAAGELGPEPVTERDALACYLANRHRFRVQEARRARHVLVAGERTAEGVLRAARGGAALSDLARRESLDRGSRGHGGDLGWVERGQLAGPLEEALFSAEPGLVTGPVQSPFGWHVFVVEGLRPARQLPFAECRDELVAEMAEDRRRAAWLEWWQRRLSEAVKVPEGAPHPLVPGLPGTGHRH